MTTPQLAMSVAGWITLGAISFVYLTIKSAKKDSQKWKDKEGNDIPIYNGWATLFPPEGAVKIIVLRGGAIVKILANVPGQYYDKRTERLTPLGKSWDGTKFVDNPAAPNERTYAKWRIKQAPLGFRWLARWFDVYWLSIIGRYRTLKYNFEWTEEEKGTKKIIARHEFTSLIFVRRSYPRTFEEIRLKSGVMIETSGVFTFEIQHIITLITIQGGDWLNQAFKTIQGQLFDLFRGKDWKPRDEKGVPTPTDTLNIDNFSREFMDGGVNISLGAKGLQLTDAVFGSWDLFGVSQGLDASYAAEEKEIQDGKGVIAKAEAEAQARERKALATAKEEEATHGIRAKVYGPNRAADVSVATALGGGNIKVLNMNSGGGGNSGSGIILPPDTIN